MTTTMKAIIHTRYGQPEVAQLMKVSKPSPKDDEVLVKVHATTVNRTDCGFRSAEYFVSRLFSGLFRPRDKTLGCEFSGIVEAIGRQVSSFQVGDKIVGYNDARFGAHAEYMTTPEKSAITIMPSNLTFQEAASLCEGAHYALCNIKAAKVKSGDKVIIYGATGAIGSAAVQLSKYFGLHVTAVCATKYVPLIQSLGADKVIDYTKEDFTQTPGTFDFIFDAVGKSSFAQCKNLLHPKGVYISTELGKRGANIFLALTTPLMGGKKVLFPIPTIHKEDVVFLKTLAEESHFKPVIDREYPLEDIVAAYKYVETGQKIGNVVITVV